MANVLLLTTPLERPTTSFYTLGELGLHILPVPRITVTLVADKGPGIILTYEEPQASNLLNIINTRNFAPPNDDLKTQVLNFIVSHGTVIGSVQDV